MMENDMLEKISKTLYNLNGTLMIEGDAGRALWKIADEIEKLNKTLIAVNDTLTAKK